MEEIADFAQADADTAAIYRAVASYYARLSHPAGAEDIAALRAFLEAS
jgi:hypothetical protein